MLWNIIWLGALWIALVGLILVWFKGASGPRVKLPTDTNKGNTP